MATWLRGDGSEATLSATMHTSSFKPLQAMNTYARAVAHTRAPVHRQAGTRVRGDSGDNWRRRSATCCG